MSHTTVCPRCHVQSAVDESSIGRFIACKQCQCLYYVVVPPLGEERKEWQSVAATSSISERKPANLYSERPLTETEILSRRVQRLTALIVLSLAITSVLLVLAVLQYLK